MTIPEAIGAELRRAREALRWTRAQLAERLPSGVHPKTVGNYEAGRVQCSVERFVELCQVMGVSSVELLSRALQREISGLQVEPTDDLDDVMGEPLWTVQVDDTVGGFIVTTYPHPLSAHDTRPDGDPARCGRIIAECCSTEDAQLIAGLLNAADVPECDLPTPMRGAPGRCGRCGKPIRGHLRPTVPPAAVAEGYSSDNVHLNANEIQDHQDRQYSEENE